ncbi:DNA mismatch endonuclease Vsr [Chitinophaga polysaccharea]|uniref:very short patch repair endonuclease n=1 Tax=Chitinophaga polysaccharea TaxID=1293035 RepID=UPI001454ED49|nr:DNA mismatch endonuclease Vsr [Chitinophaga polysaccharea]NLR58905.1 DNA mismatch endonuclease Vsr [Chitinophaga polysaccharea]
MTDVHSVQIRSYNMSRIKSKNTKPEILVRKFLFAHGLRYKLHDNTLPGKPDLVFPRYRKVVFINGCFWHGHKGCKYSTIPKTRTTWWLEKITKNMENDSKVIHSLKQLHWDVIIVWGCQLKGVTKKKTLKNLLDKIKDNIF